MRKMTDIIDNYGNIKGFTPTNTVNDVKKIVEPVDERYKLDIFPQGFSDDEDLSVSLIFNDDKKAWDRYKKLEWDFTVQEYNAYLIAPHEARRAARDEFYAKRVLFAKQSNFVPSKGVKDEWVFNPVAEKKVLA